MLPVVVRPRTGYGALLSTKERRSIQAEEENMILATWNVNSVTVRLNHVLTFLDRVRPNVLCMQETKVIDDKFPRAEIEALGYVIEIFGEKSYNGVAIASDKPLQDVVRGFPTDEQEAQKRLISGIYDGIRIIDVYIPNGGELGSDKYAFKLRWLEELERHLRTAHDAGTPLVICGDFNVAPQDIDVFDPIALKGAVLMSEPERSALERIRAWGLEDVFRKHHPGRVVYSWWDYRAGAFKKDQGLRIDHVWATQSLAVRSRSIYIDREMRRETQPSDHAPIIVEFADIEDAKEADSPDVACALA